MQATPGRRRRLTTFWRRLDRAQRRTLLMMVAVVGGLHVLGFATLIALIAPGHYRLGATGAFTIGVGLTAYTLGLRHAFDADHIAAIDNTTRKLMAEGKRPLSVGFWFSLGHSTIVFALALALSVGIRSLAGPVTDGDSQLHRVTGWIGTAGIGQLSVPDRRASTWWSCSGSCGCSRTSRPAVTTSESSSASSTAVGS